MLQVIQDPGRVFYSYSKLEKLKPGHLATIKSFMLLKRSKNSLNCFRVKFCQRQNTYEINTQETHQLMTPQSAKVTFAQSKPRILHSILHPLFESASFKIMIKHSFYVELRWIREFALHDKRQCCLMRFCYRASFLS